MPRGLSGALRALLPLALLWLAAAAAAAPEAPPPPRAGWGRLWVELPAQAAPAVREYRELRNRHNLLKLGLALAGTGALAWGLWLRRAGRPRAGERARHALLAGAALAAGFGWWNFFYFHYPSPVHVDNVVVYYVGSKYFPELGYRRLYECIAVADARAGLGARVEQRSLTDLHSYGVIGAREILAHPERCTDHFSPERWALFEHDVRWFRERVPAALWEEVQRDHGFNASPVWGAAGYWLAGRGPLTDLRLLALIGLDSLLDLLMWGAVAWAFGWQALCVAVLYWGTNHPAEFAWVGGSYLRDDWLAATLVGFALLRRGHPLGAGFCIGYAALLRAFPLLFFAPLAFQALGESWRARRLQARPEHWRAAAGALLAALVFVPLSAATFGGESWRAFGENLALHVGTPSNNAVGLKSLLSFHPQRSEAAVAASADPGQAWKEGRLETYRPRRTLHWALALAFTLLLARAVQGREAWVAAILGYGLVLVWLEPSCYYTTPLAAYGLLWIRWPGIGVALGLLSVAGWAVAAFTLHWDAVFAASGALMLAFVSYATVSVARRGDPAAP